MNLSYWERKSWFTNVDFTIIGSGIVGLNCALHIKEKYPKATVLLLEKGVLPQGASTKNAGFACFGSLSEIIDDLKSHTEQEVVDLVRKRWQGLQLLRKKLGDKNIDFQQDGGYELFNDTTVFEECSDKKETINRLLKPIFKENVFSFCTNKFGFSNIKETFAFNQYEGQLDTGKMMTLLLHLVLKSGVKILNSTIVEDFEDVDNHVIVKLKNFEFNTKRLLIATNGFSNQWVQEDIQPARAQVLITKPIKNLHVKGSFHLEKGYYYFRNIDNRILLGGGRNLDFETEETTEFGMTKLILSKLEDVLKTTILPTTIFEIDYGWSGIMGVGQQKKAIVKKLSNNVACGVRLGGMGVAIGSLIGEDLAKLV